ncbi:unnamed protein product, partial [Gulo gulo]
QVVKGQQRVICLLKEQISNVSVPRPCHARGAATPTRPPRGSVGQMTHSRVWLVVSRDGERGSGRPDTPRGRAPAGWDCGPGHVAPRASLWGS